MSNNERQQRMVERVQEDERLRGDLPDDAATALVEWASKRVAAAAADPARPDAEVEAEVQMIRAAARAAARADEAHPQRVLALAETELTQRRASAAQPDAVPQVAAPSAAPMPTTNLAAEVGASSAAGAGAAQTQPPANTPQPPVGFQAQVSQEQRKPSSLWRHWNPFAGFLKRIRGGH